MKWLILFLFILPMQVMAATDFKLVAVKVDCKDSELCTDRITRYKNLVGDYRSLLHLKETLRIMASDGGYEDFDYDITKTNDTYQLNIRIKLKPVIEDINVGFSDKFLEMNPLLLISLKEGEFFEPQKLKLDLAGLTKRIELLGYPDNTHTFTVETKGSKVYIDVAITLREPRIFKSIKTNTASPYVKDFLVKKFNTLYGKPFEFTKFKFYLDEAQKELFSYGYYLINLDFVPVIKGRRVTLDIKIVNDKLFAFDFQNLQDESRHIMLELVRDLFRRYKRPLSESTLKAAIEEHYRKKAMLNTGVHIEMDEFENGFKEMVTLYRIRFDEKYKTRLTNISFNGNVFFTSAELKKIYDKEAFELASINYYDEEYLNFYVGLLKTKYFEKGYVQVRIVGPNKVFSPDKSMATVEYLIQEGQRAFVKNLTFDGMPGELQERVNAKLVNKAGKPFNPIAMAEDIKLVALMLQEKGYYFAEVTNANDEGLVQYSKSGSDVDIRYMVNSGPMVKLNRVIFLGNNKTRKKVLVKKVTLEEGDIINPAKTREIESNISATGLFNSVSVAPIRHSSKNAATDLIIRVQEREFGLVEIAPGFRTDLGIKLTTTLSYVNIGGMNRSITLRNQVNQRLNYQTLDPQRRKQQRKVLEHNETLTYTQGDIFNTMVDFSAGLTYQRKRFYSFDADIARTNATFTRDLTKKLSTSARYQLEKISQYNSPTNPEDVGSFQIGAITPSLTYDLRNSAVNTLRGAFFNMSVEFANPYFLSQKTDNLIINYYKLVSRNRFYIPFKNGTVAISMVAGIQENLAKDPKYDSSGVREVDSNGVKQTEGYIPNIKVFRLTGMDSVRGFSDEEINRLPNRNDISEERIQNKAYLANFKLEPRYFLNDSLMGGIFFDAGRVYVGQVDLNQLRTSAGVTFKVLTPVGTLDFDYGIKLLRERNKDGTLEDPGRFHVSIGFF